MTTEIQGVEPPELGPGLLARPQRLGFLPTWSFWRDEENSRLVKWPIWLVIAVAFTLALVTDVGWFLAGLLPVIAITITLGVIERYVRRRALERRALALAADKSVAVGEGEGSRTD